MKVAFSLLMKFKNLYLLLFTAVVVFSVTDLSVLSTFRKQIKRQVKMTIKQSKLKPHEILVFEATQIPDAIWVEPHEFIFGDQMYDVIKKEEKNGKTYYHCFKDSNENKVRKLQEFIAKTFHKKQPKIYEIGVAKIFAHPTFQYLCIQTTQEFFSFKKMKLARFKILQSEIFFPEPQRSRIEIPPEVYF